MNAYSDWYFPSIRIQLNVLFDRVEILAANDPDGYKTHPMTKNFKAIWKSLKNCTLDPTKPEYRCTGSLPKDCSHWRRIKKGMPDRHRLFFQYQSTGMKVIYVWMNGHKNLRREGHKSDVYKAFTALVKKGAVPNTFCELLRQSQKELLAK